MIKTINKQKILFLIARYFVGALFVFSGLIKINDPIGTEIKLEEYFHVFSESFHPFFEYLIPYALGLSIFLCVLEVVLGFALLFSYKLRLTIYLLISIIVFFTILTAYSAITNKVTDCGCFGDAIKITPWGSFYKDLVLSFFIAILYFFQPSKTPSTSIAKHVYMGVITVVCIAIASWAVYYLPFIDFRPYYVGSDIGKKINASAEYKYEYRMINPQGEKEVFTTYPTTKGYKLDTMILTNPEARPLIVDFSVWSAEEDETDKLLEGEKALIILQNPEVVDMKSQSNLATKLSVLINKSKFAGVKWALVSSTSEEEVSPTLKELKLSSIPLMFADATLLKAVIRSPIGILILENGKVIGKWTYRSLPNGEEFVEKFN